MWGTGKDRKDTGGWTSIEHEVANQGHLAMVAVKKFLDFLMTPEGVVPAQKSNASVGCDFEVEVMEEYAVSYVQSQYVSWDVMMGRMVKQEKVDSNQKVHR